jgi:hypothetical protein
MLFGGRPAVSRQGIAFDYSSPAELYLSRRRGRHTDYRRFATAAEAIHYAVEELRARRSLSAWMQVGDKRLSKNEINRLYDDGDYPLSKSLRAAARPNRVPFTDEAQDFDPHPRISKKGLKTGHCD